MDNDPSQNSEVAQATLKELNCELVAIPPCSPDLNPIEIVFTSENLLQKMMELNIKFVKSPLSISH